MVRTHKTNRGNGGKDENSRSKMINIVVKVIRFCFRDILKTKKTNILALIDGAVLKIN